MEIWKLNPVYKDYLWGGQSLKNNFNAKTDLDLIAESWVLSVHKDGTNLIESGKFKGKHLKEVLDNKKYWGENSKKFDFFPVMVKLIDAASDLSIQVHPSDELSLEVEGQYGKTEVWYVLDAEEDTYLYYGLKQDITKEEFKELLCTSKLETVLNKVYVKPGDVLMVDSGTIHAICKGALVAEIQQNSNVTYRLYDYNRKDKNGQLRPLHIEKAIQAANLSKRNVDKTPVTVEQCGGNTKILVAQNKYFTASVYTIDEKLSLEVTEKTFKNIVVLDGEFFIENMKFQKGESAFIPAGEGKAEIEGSGKLLITEV